MTGQIIDCKLNILDLHEALVSEQFSEKPIGYRTFVQTLHEINAPSNFLSVIGTLENGAKKSLV